MGTVNEQIDTIWLRTQINIPEGSKSEITYLVNRNESVIDSGNIVIKDTEIKNLYYLPIPLIQYKRGKYEIELKFLGEVQKTTFLYGIKTKNYWTDDIDEMVGVMRYILTYSEYRKLKEKNDSDRWETINTYWKEKDPSPETPENELLEELNERVKYSNKNFSILMHGWRSDRGRIYIIYGAPQLVDDSYQDNMGYYYQQKWVYSNGKEFIFIDRTRSGDYTLYQERF
jgi:GWxTD domain-containing protein